jgi:hypothetical protein
MFGSPENLFSGRRPFPEGPGSICAGKRARAQRAPEFRARGTVIMGNGTVG